MSFLHSNAPTRTIATHKEWVPRPYQRRAEKFLIDNCAAALFLDPGLGKTSVVLSAFSKLLAKGVAKKMLVIAPLRVCELVWEQEAAEWTQFRHLRFSFIHGTKKQAALDADADVFLINPEGIPWLIEALHGRGWPFDTTVIDELTKFKNSQAKRFKLLHGGKGKRTVTGNGGKKIQIDYTFPNIIANSIRRWGLTGTPAPNGLLDLFGQLLILDDGVSLGRYITHYRDKYFIPGYTGFDWQPQPGAEERIREKLENIALRMKAEDYLDLPELLDDVRRINLDKKSKAKYDQMREQMLATLPEGEVVASNAAAVTSKLKQMANGAVYTTPEPGEKRTVAHVHAAKLDALEELIDELAGAPLLIAYEFNHDLACIKERFGEDLPYLGSGVSSKRAAEIEKLWNQNKLPVLAVHPASVGHGLNMQKGSASHICWFSVTWDLELYEQLIRRLRRSGNTSKFIMNHILAVVGTVDFVCLASIREKDSDQASFLQGLKGVLHGDADGYATGLDVDNEESADMAIKRLKRPSEGDAAEVKPAGWGDKEPETGSEEELTAKLRSKVEEDQDQEETTGLGTEDKKVRTIRRASVPPEPETEEDDDLKAAEEALAAAKAKAAAKAEAAAKEAAAKEAAAKEAEKAEDEKPKRVTRTAATKSPAGESPFKDDTPISGNGGYDRHLHVTFTFSGDRDDVRALLKAMGNAL